MSGFLDQTIKYFKKTFNVMLEEKKVCSSLELFCQNIIMPRYLLVVGRWLDIFKCEYSFGNVQRHVIYWF